MLSAFRRLIALVIVVLSFSVTPAEAATYYWSTVTKGPGCLANTVSPNQYTIVTVPGTLKVRLRAKNLWGTLFVQDTSVGMGNSWYSYLRWEFINGSWVGIFRMPGQYFHIIDGYSYGDRNGSRYTSAPASGPGWWC